MCDTETLTMEVREDLVESKILRRDVMRSMAVNSATLEPLNEDWPAREERAMELWEMDLDEYRAHVRVNIHNEAVFLRRTMNEHLAIVRKAVSEGKAVPVGIVESYREAGYDINEGRAA